MWCVCVCVCVLCVCGVCQCYSPSVLQNGNPEGKGLVTFADGTHGLPRNEGRFTGGKCVERCKVAGQVLQAQKDAAMARSIAEQAGN